MAIGIPGTQPNPLGIEGGTGVEQSPGVVATSENTTAEHLLRDEDIPSIEQTLTSTCRTAFLDLAAEFNPESDDKDTDNELWNAWDRFLEALQTEADVQIDRELWYSYQMIKTLVEAGFFDKALLEIIDAIDLAHQMYDQRWEVFFLKLEAEIQETIEMVLPVDSK